MKKILSLVVISLCIIVILTACWGSNPSTDEPTPSQPQEVPVSTPIRVGDAVWTVTGVEKSPVFGGNSEPPNGIYVAVHIALQNASKETQTAPDLTVIDSQGNKTTSVTGKYVDAPESWGPQLLMEGMGGGAVINGFYLFDILPDATGLKLLVKGWSWTEKQEGYINLGI
jgi:hypothetical protein